MPTEADEVASAPTRGLENPRGFTLVVAVLSLAAAGAACGRAHPLTGSPADGAAPSTVDTTSTPPTPAACAVETTQKPPFAVTFHFRSDGTTPVYLHKSGCTKEYEYGVSSCASGFAEPLGPIPVFCGRCDCAGPMCLAVSCGACYPDEGTAVAPGADVARDWAGLAETPGTRSGSTACVTSSPLPAGKYRVAIRVYGSAAEAEHSTGGWIATRDFELPAPGASVVVPLGEAAASSCEARTGAAAKTCTGSEASGIACDLAQSFTYDFEGGELSAYQETYVVGVPADFSVMRTSFVQDPTVPPPPPPKCETKIPRCSDDARELTTSDVARALAAPSVASAFALTMPMYGMRTTFGTSLVVKRADGTSLSIGDDCPAAGVPDCKPVTTEMTKLRSVLSKLESDLINRSCPDLGAH